MVFRVADYLYAPAEGSYHVAFGHRFLRVVRPLGVNVWAQREQKFGHGRLVKDRHVVHRAQRRDRLGALALGDVGAALALQVPHLLVGVYADDEQVAERARGFEVSHVADVQEVEAPVCEDDARAALARNRDARYQAVAFEYAPGRARLPLVVLFHHSESYCNTSGGPAPPPESLHIKTRPRARARREVRRPSPWRFRAFGRRCRPRGWRGARRP